MDVPKWIMLLFSRWCVVKRVFGGNIISSVLGPLVCVVWCVVCVCLSKLEMDT